MSAIQVPVLIVGGGGCGLTSSIFLSDHGIDHLLVERHPGTSVLPRAHYLNQRTMEVLRQHGVADSIYEVGTPIENFGKVRWNTTLSGDGPLDGRTIFEMDAFGGGSLRERYEQDSPCLSSNYPLLPSRPPPGGSCSTTSSSSGPRPPTGSRPRSATGTPTRPSPWRPPT